MKNKKHNRTKTFQEAVISTPDISSCYRQGIQALGKDANYIQVAQSRLLHGSVFIDECTSSKYPEDNRWDYVFAYDSEVFFVEVHSAKTDQVQKVIKKLQWLKNWLNGSAPEIKQLQAKNRPAFYWIHSSKFAIPKGAPQLANAVQAGLRPVSQLRLD